MGFLIRIQSGITLNVSLESMESQVAKQNTLIQ